MIATRDRGVMAVFSDCIFGGRDVRKYSTYQTDAFNVSNFGCMGHMIDGMLNFYNASSRAHATMEYRARQLVRRQPHHR